MDVLFVYTPTTTPPFVTLSPTFHQTVSGSLTLSIAGSSLAKAASVEYTLGTHRIARIAAQPGNPNFQFNWNSALASDGSNEIEITARDYLDNVLFQDVCPITLSNFGNSARTGVSSALTGSSALALSAYDNLNFPAYWQIFLDGEILPTTTGLLFSDQDGVHANSRTTTLDTTLYPNGKHELHFAFHSNRYPATNGTRLDFRGMATQNVNIDNGRALMEILPNYLFIYTPVSTGVQLTCSRAYTDGFRDACSSPTYSVNTATTSAGISVTNSGLVIGSQEGYGDILVSDSGKSATTHVWIRNSAGLPHFQDAGKMGTSYIAGKSLYVMSPFQLSPELLITNSQLLLESKRAGINTLNQGMFLQNGNTALSFAAWKQNFDSLPFASSYAWAAANGFRILGSGDDIARRPGWEGWWITNWPAAGQAVQYAAQVFSQSGAGLAIDVVDEANLLWGSNPAPVGTIGAPHSFQSAACIGTQCTFSWLSLTNPLDYQFHDFLWVGKTFALGGSSALTTPSGRAATLTALTGATATFTNPSAILSTLLFNPITTPSLEFLWFSGATSCIGNTICNPLIANSTLSNTAAWLRTASPTVPISWPVAGAAAPYIYGNWMKPGSVSDYASHYWDSNQQRRTYVFGMGARETQNSMLTAFLSRQSLIDINRPQLLEQSVAGMDYLKYSPLGTAIYNPPVDQLEHVGETARGVSAGIMTAAAVGTAGVRTYKYDNTFLNRFNNKGDGTEMEMDAGPSTGEILNWQAMGYAGSTLTKSLQEFILGQPVNSPYLGRNIVTGARVGTNGNLLSVVNGWDGSRTIAVDLSAYRTGGNVFRYRVSDVAIKIQSLGNVVNDTVTLVAGETAIYLFLKSSAPSAIDWVTFQPDLNSSRTVLRTNYLYERNTAPFGDAVDCSGGCTVPIDRKLGEAFYSYAVLDSAGAVQCRSPAILVPSGASVALAVAPQTRGFICQ